MIREKISHLFLIFIVCLSFSQCSSTSVKKDPEKKDTVLYQPDFRFDSLNVQEAALYTNAVHDFYDTLLLKSRFNGAVLVAKNGQVLFEQYKGYSNFITKDTLTEHTAFHIASTSKTFTGMAVLRLWEDGALSLEDTLQKYFPQLPYHG